MVLPPQKHRQLDWKWLACCGKMSFWARYGGRPDSAFLCEFRVAAPWRRLSRRRLALWTDGLVEIVEWSVGQAVGWCTGLSSSTTNPDHSSIQRNTKKQSREISKSHMSQCPPATMKRHRTDGSRNDWDFGLMVGSSRNSSAFLNTPLGGVNMSILFGRFFNWPFHGRKSWLGPDNTRHFFFVVT